MSIQGDLENTLANLSEDTKDTMLGIIDNRKDGGYSTEKAYSRIIEVFEQNGIIEKP